MIAVGNENKINKIEDRCNYCNHMPMLPLSGGNHCLPLFHQDKNFIWLNKKKHINELTIGYIIISDLNVNRNFIEPVDKCMFTTFGATKQPLIKYTFF